MSSGSSSRSSSGSSSGSSKSSKSTGSRSTTSYFSPNIEDIRETCGTDETAKGTVFIRRYDDAEEYITSVWDSAAYNMQLGEVMAERVPSSDYWKAYNTIASWILEGNIRLSGGRDCFKRLAKPPKPGVGTLQAGDGIFFEPDQNIPTFGTIHPSAEGNALTTVHITRPSLDSHNRPRNRITLQRGTRYLIAGDGLRSMISDRYLPELLICNRGRLLEAGFEITGDIGKEDLWILDSAGKYKDTQPMRNWEICSGCLHSFANREWPTPDVCDHTISTCTKRLNGFRLRVEAKGYLPALAQLECAACVVGTYRGLRTCYPRSIVRNLARVLDASFTIQGWDHLAEMTGFSSEMLVLFFCSLPSFGKRLDTKGASFVPWARESGITLGEYVRVRRTFLIQHVYVVSGQAVIEIHTGLKIKFQDDNGVLRVERGSEDFSERLPEGVSGYVCLG